MFICPSTLVRPHFTGPAAGVQPPCCMAVLLYDTLHLGHCGGCGHTSITIYIVDGVHYDFVSRAAPTSIFDAVHYDFFDGHFICAIDRPLWWTRAHELHFLYLLFRFYLSEVSPDDIVLTGVAPLDLAWTVRDNAYVLGSDSVLHFDVLASFETYFVDVMGE